ncbi:MAG: N-6 DNA methylase, partial [Chloroflexi bacterium]|nr:N-6 DNA methylase [Chloroflexota bacterium]
MPASGLSTYRAAIEREVRAGATTEHTFRPGLKALLEALGPDIVAINEPKRVACGAPDFVVARSSKHGPLTLGYVETKDLGVALDGAERSEQLQRYRAALHNLVLTDYLEFRWYVDGALRQTARIGDLDGHGRVVAHKAGETAVEELLRLFLAHQPEPIARPRELAERMARLTRMVRDIIVQAFERKEASKTLQDLRKAFEEVLLPGLSAADFADMLAQTFAYGLFAARCQHQGSAPFRRHDAAYEIPRTNPFLRQLFGTLAGPALDDEPFVGFVDDLAQLLAETDMAAVLADFGQATRQEDPIVHFYETFLKAYDPRLREMRGVYYTPEPVVSYIVRSVDHLLRTRFGCALGLTDASRVSGTPALHRVLILDPACGTGTFLYAVVNLIRAAFMEQGNAGKWSGYVREDLLPRLFGFELLMAPYAVAHLKLGMQLAAQDLPEDMRRNWAHDFQSGDRLGVYLTNSLEEALKKSELLLGSAIADEANAAAEIKRDRPIMVVLGNPPYSGHSANRGAWIRRLVSDYYQVDSKPLGERNPKWLQNDYVKFLRFGQWRIALTGQGVLAFITDHSYLDSPTFRGMRQQLMNAFT